MAKPTTLKLKLDFAAPRRDLLAAIDAALPACGQQSGMPILSTLQVTALASGRVTISAADLIVSCAASLLCPVHVPGSVCLPSKLFRDIVAKMGEGVVSITYDGASTTITGAGKRKATGIATIPGEDFPEMLRPTGDPVTIPAAALFAALKIARSSMSTDDTRPHLAATFLEVRDGSLRAISTDGHRMTIAPAKAEGARALQSALIPKTFLDRAKIPAEGDLQLWIAGKSGPLFIRKGDTTWSTKLVDAAFPSFDQVIPNDWSLTVTCDRAQLADAVSAVSIVASDRTSGVRFRVDPEKGVMEITSENPDTGAMTDEVPCEVDRVESKGSQGSNGVYIGFNGRYVLDTLGALSGDRVTLRFSGELDPCRIEDAALPGFVGVWMPMRIQGQ